MSTNEGSVQITIDSLDDLLEAEDKILNKGNNTKKKTKKTDKKESAFKRISKWWKRSSKGTKALVIIIMILVLLLLAGLVFLLLHKEEEIEEEVKEPDVIVVLDNYRYENGVLVFLSENNEIGRYTCENKNEEQCFISYYTDEEEFDIPIKVDTEGNTIEERVPIVNERFVFITDDEKQENSILYDISTNTKVEEYKLVKKASLDDLKYIVKSESDKYDIIDLTNEATLANLSYEYIGFLNHENRYVMLENNKEYVIDGSGSKLSSGLSGKIKEFTNQYIVVSNDFSEYKVYDYKGKDIFQDTYDYISLHSDYAVLIKNKRAYFKFYDNKKLVEEPIDLYNENYNKIKVYEDLKLVEEKNAFDIEDTESTINFTVKNNDSTKEYKINKNEGLVSKKLPYINYFDGTLYFYIDEDKEVLLGSYLCTNQNNIANQDSELSNCYIATNTSFEANDMENAIDSKAIPIFNERFVFIRDNKNLVNDSNKTINLYDLNAKKVLSSYKDVNTFTQTDTYDAVFQTANNHDVICKNKSDKFGIIKINSNGVKGFVNFAFNRIESMKDYYLVQNDDGYFLINKSDGESMTSAVPNKIMSYTDTYLITKDNNQYAIYNYDGEKISNDYEYLDLYKEVYVGINNQKLELYNYTKKENLLESEVTLNTTDYKNGYRLIIHGEEFALEVLENDTYQKITEGVWEEVKDEK